AVGAGAVTDQPGPAEPDRVACLAAATTTAADQPEPAGAVGLAGLQADDVAPQILVVVADRKRAAGRRGEEVTILRGEDAEDAGVASRGARVEVAGHRRQLVLRPLHRVGGLRRARARVAHRALGSAGARARLAAGRLLALGEL